MLQPLIFQCKNSFFSSVENLFECSSYAHQIFRKPRMHVFIVSNYLQVSVQQRQFAHIQQGLDLDANIFSFIVFALFMIDPKHCFRSCGHTPNRHKNIEHTCLHGHIFKNSQLASKMLFLTHLHGNCKKISSSQYHRNFGVFFFPSNENGCVRVSTFWAA